MKFERRNRIEPNFNYASLTDIVLQLLIFFLLSSSFVSSPGIKVALPKSQTSDIQAERQTVITITKNGKIYLNSTEVTTATLAQRLIPVLDKDREQVVIIRADQDVSLQKAVEVIDLAKGVGAQRFMIATEPGDGE
ncbi:MAG: biopolymer transporter ExbD [Bacteroidetes bacterium]|nr:MAG: biopolymer transporter ExbD [Bacteroidota bacterium]